MEGSIDIWRSTSNETQVADFHLGDTLTRENFSDLFLQSVAFSRSRDAIIRIYFDWAGKNGDFDWENDVTKFRDLGGWNLMVDTEKDNFLHALNSVPAHHERAGFKQSPYEEFNSNPVQAMQKLLDSILSEKMQNMAVRAEEMIGELKGMSKIELTRNVNVLFFGKHS